MIIFLPFPSYITKYREYNVGLWRSRLIISEKPYFLVRHEANRQNTIPTRYSRFLIPGFFKTLGICASTRLEISSGVSPS